MANDFFSASGAPATGSQGSSATMRAEFASIEDGFDKLPALTGNGGKVVVVNSGGTALESVTTTGTGNAVRATSPTLVTPTIGVATATSINGTTIPSSSTLITSGGALGQPSSGNLSNCIGLPVSTGISNLGAGVAVALGVSAGSSGGFIVSGGALGTPSSGTVTNLTGTASININGTVGATTPTTGAFTTVSASGVFTGPDGTASAPTYSFSSSGNSDNGMYLSAANEVSWTTGGTKRLTLTSDGRLYGTALHNNAGAVTGTTNQYIASGTYTPTLTGVTNVDSVSSGTGIWIRVGNVVTLSGSFSVNPNTTSLTTVVGISLPIASNFTAVTNCIGSSVISPDAGVTNPGSISADTTNDRMSITFAAVTDTAYTIYFNATYVIL